MKRGRLPETPSTKLARGTIRPARDGQKCEVIVPAGLPQQPTWLTDAGQQEWLDAIARVAVGRIVTEADSALFGVLCNLMGSIGAAWQAGEVPPAAFLTEARRLSELFGLAGSKSRVGAPIQKAAENPFAKLRTQSSFEESRSQTGDVKP